MTERTEIVEPPLASRRVQITLAVLASVTLICLMVTTWRHSTALPKDIAVGELGLEEGGLGETAVLRIDLNVAEPRELALLPRVGPILANRIVENRRRFGPFATVDDLGRVHGIGPKTLDQIRGICEVDSASQVIRGDERLASASDYDESERTGSFGPAGR